MTAACPACVAAPAAIDCARIPNAVQLSVPGMRCAACIAKIETHLERLTDVSEARVNLSQKRVRISTERSAEDMADALGQIGFDAFPLDGSALSNDADPTGRDLLMRLGLAGFAMMNVMLLSVAVWSGADGATRDLFHLISAAIALPVVLYAAQPFFRNAMGALRVGRLNMDVPISLAILLAGAMSLYETLHGGAHAYFDAALSLTFFLLIGRYLEHRTRSAARSAARELAALEVHTATRRTARGVETVPLSALQPGDRVLVPTGVRVPVDGSLTSREAYTDRSFLTGESAPVTHSHDAALNAGEINLGAALEMRATAVGQETRLHQIARLVETAETARNRYTSLADRAAQIYAPAVHIVAFATFLGWVAVTQDARQSLNVAIAVLIITCPCALGLAVPAVTTAAISRLFQLGFLVKSGTALERLAEVQTVVLDKTGTLTTPGFAFELGTFSATDLQAAKALAQASAHPLAKALYRYLAEVEPAQLDGICETKGNGVSASFEGMTVALGRAQWLGGSGDGLVLRIGEALYPLPYHETLKSGVNAMTSGLTEAELTLEIMSGDTQDKTAQLAKAAGIGTYFARMSPEAKSARIAELTKQSKNPCMIGDGLNDTVALAGAHASIAPGSALDAARNAADVVVIKDTLEDVPALFAIARKAVRLSRQNFGIALGYNAIAVPIAVLGYATPLAAALAMSLSSVTVLLNAIRVGRVQ
jgi:Cu2+-exporting ATPase